MNHDERLDRALKYGDFYELALLTYEGDENEKEQRNATGNE